MTIGKSNREELTLILSQDYELFFHDSGTPEHCLFEPCDALLQLSRSLDLKITFFVDVGMIRCMDRFASANRRVATMRDEIKQHIESIAKAGHEVALHIHPHWEDSAWRHDKWDFSASRYALHQFSTAEVATICTDYANVLGELSGESPTAYRAGGFCVEPFTDLGPSLLDAGIHIDSSIVPGARLTDSERGFDFTSAPDKAWWLFGSSPLQPNSKGPFGEIPVTPQGLGAFYYWQRLLNRFRPRRSAAGGGNGVSRRPGNREILRRLVGQSRVAELSVDEPKVRQLATRSSEMPTRSVWHLMGHPKLLTQESIVQVEEFVRQWGFQKFETVSSLAESVCPRPTAASPARVS